MRRLTIILLGVVLLLAAAWGLTRREPGQLRAGLVPAAAAAASTEGYARAEGPQPLAFPADHGPHPDFQTEWWYFTGNLDAPSGEHFGYQLTFFRRALVPPQERVRRESAWAAEDVFLAHFALTDVAGGDHRSLERLSRGAAGLAGAQAEPFRVWLEDWSVEEQPDGRWRLVAAADGVVVELQLDDLKGPVLQGDAGYSRKGPEPGNASVYYSLPRMASEGSITAGGRTLPVTGLSWMDHEYSTSALGPDQAGWDWFSIQLDDGSELMVFQLRREDGSVDAFSSGTLAAADGSTTALGPGDFAIEATGIWRSPRTGARYPSGWIVTVPSAGLRLALEPWLDDQEMETTYTYWEGAVRATGERAGAAVAGNGYVELTGYAGSMQGHF